MTNATFNNFTDKPFTGYWNGKSKTFKPGDSVYMPAYLAEHFAKHLTNRTLQEMGKETYCSPKNPGQVPQFMEIFNKAFIRDEVSEHQNELDAEISSVQAKAPSANIGLKPRDRVDVSSPAAAQERAANAPADEELNVGPGKNAQIITAPDGDDDDESGFDHGDKA